MNPEELDYYEKHAKNHLANHWKDVASKKFEEKREELRKRIEKFDQMERDFESKKSISWIESMKYIERLARL